MTKSTVVKIDGFVIPIIFCSAFGKIFPYNFSPYLHSGPQLLALLFLSAYLVFRLFVQIRTIQFFSFKSLKLWNIYLFGIFLLIISFLISSLSSPNVTDSLIGEPGRRLGFLTWLLIITNSYLFALNQRFSKFEVEKLFHRTFYAHIVIGLLQGLGILTFLGDKNNVGILSNEDLYSIACGAAVLISIFKLARDSKRLLFMNLMFLALALYELIRSQALSGVILSLTGIFYSLLWRFRKNTIRVKALGTSIVIIGAILLFFSPYILKDPNTQIRISIWTSVWNIIVKQVNLFGSGLDSMVTGLIPRLNYEEIWTIEGLGRNQLWDNPHSSFFTVLYSGGLIGILGYTIYFSVGLFVFIKVNLSSYEYYEKNRELSFISTLWLGLFLSSLFSVGNPLLYQIEFLLGFIMVLCFTYSEVRVMKMRLYQVKVLALIAVIVSCSFVFYNKIYVPEKSFRVFASMPKVNKSEIQKSWDEVLKNRFQCGHALYILQNPQGYSIGQSVAFAENLISSYKECPTGELLLLVAGLNAKNNYLVDTYSGKVTEWNPDLVKLRELIDNFKNANKVSSVKD